MARKRWPITSHLWGIVEKTYLDSATDQQKGEYSRMTRKEKGRALIDFVHKGKSKPNAWAKLLIARLTAFAASEE
jgi:hypothetical protein